MTSRLPPTVRNAGAIETALAQAVTEAYRSVFGRAPAEVRAHLVADGLALVHARQVLIPAETALAPVAPDQARAFHLQVLDRVVPHLRVVAESILGAPVRALLTDVCPLADESILVIRHDSPGAQDRSLPARNGHTRPGSHA